MREELAELVDVRAGVRKDRPSEDTSSSSEVKVEISEMDGSTGEEQRSLLSGETKVDGRSSVEACSTSMILIDSARFLCGGPQ